MEKKMAKRTLISIILFGLVGQIAWCIENNYLNLFMRRTVTSNPYYIAWMIAASAIVATLTTLIMGYVSDKVGKRKVFMSIGYIIWGFSIMAFCLFSKENMAKLFNCDVKNATIIAGVGIIVMDCLMTFFGSTANDASFNAWITDNTNKTNRGRVEALLSVFTIAGYAIVMLVFDPITKNTYYDAFGNKVDVDLATASQVNSGITIKYGNWTLFFCILGAFTILIGLLGLFLLKDSLELQPNKDAKISSVFYGFKPSVIKENKNLYLVLLALGINGIAMQSYNGYILIYIENTLRCSSYIIPYAIIYGLGAVGGVVIGNIIDKKENKIKYSFIGIGLSFIGCVFMYFISPTFIDNTNITLPAFCVFALLHSLGWSILNVIFLSIFRNMTPKDKTGLFQGIRMVFYVCLPMVIGPILTAIFITNEKNVIGIDEFGEKIYSCPPLMFLIAGVIILFCLIPSFILYKKKPEELMIEEKENGATK